MAARAGALHFLHAELPGALGGQRRARGEWLPRLCARNLESAATGEPGKTGTALSQSAGDQSRVASVGCSANDRLSGGDQAEYWRERRWNRKVFYAGKLKGRGGCKAFVFWDRLYRKIQLLVIHRGL